MSLPPSLYGVCGRSLLMPCCRQYPSNMPKYRKISVKYGQIPLNLSQNFVPHRADGSRHSRCPQRPVRTTYWMFGKRSPEFSNGRADYAAERLAPVALRRREVLAAGAEAHTVRACEVILAVGAVPPFAWRRVDLRVGALELDRPVLAPRRVRGDVCNSDAFRVSETDSATNRESITVSFYNRSWW